ncbi:hypothetical protein HDU98_004321 [Podochytrium sp. JEL0797]|nr:hypothetical protein HDU98_004321 [Podochytrium sp. JEL0797]
MTRLASIASLPLDVFAPETAEASLVSKAKALASSLSTRIKDATLIAYRKEVLVRKIAWVRSVAIANPFVPAPMHLREDLLPHLNDLGVFAVLTRSKLNKNSAETTDTELNALHDECVADMEATIKDFKALETTCQNSIHVNKSVAAELQQAAVFSAATRKLIIADILEELCSRINVCVFASPHASTPSNSKPWDVLIESFTQTRKRQEQVYSTTHKLILADPPQPQPQPMNDDQNALDSCSQVSFNIASPGSMHKHSSLPQQPHQQKQKSESNSGTTSPSEGLLRKRKLDSSIEESPILGTTSNLAKKRSTVQPEEDSDESRVQMTPLVLGEGAVDDASVDIDIGVQNGQEFIAQQDLSKHEEGRVLVEDTNSQQVQTAATPIESHPPVLSESAHARPFSTRTPKSSQSSRTTAGEYMDHLYSSQNQHQEAAGDEMEEEDEDEDDGFGNSEYSVVDVGLAEIHAREGGGEVAVSAESDGSCVAQMGGSD